MSKYNMTNMTKILSNKSVIVGVLHNNPESKQGYLI